MARITSNGWCFPEVGEIITGKDDKIFEGREYIVIKVKSALNGETKIITDMGTFFYPWDCKFVRSK